MGFADIKQQMVLQQIDDPWVRKNFEKLVSFFEANDEFQSAQDARIAALEKNSVAGIVPENLIYVRDGNGFGSTATKIRRFAVVVENTGSAVTYADSVVNGSSFTINEAGIYLGIYGDRPILSTQSIGFSLNSPTLTTNISSLTADEILGIAVGLSGSHPYTIFLKTLSKTDVIRAHTDGGPNATTVYTHFTLMRVF